MWEKIKKVLSFIRLLDENGDLSITNICAILVIYRFAGLEAVSTSDMVSLLAVISTYQFKRYVQRSSK